MGEQMAGLVHIALAGDGEGHAAGMVAHEQMGADVRLAGGDGGGHRGLGDVEAPGGLGDIAAFGGGHHVAQGAQGQIHRAAPWVGTRASRAENMSQTSSLRPGKMPALICIKKSDPIPRF